MKKSYFIIAILFAAVLGAGVFVWERQQKEVQETQEETTPQPAIITKDHVLARVHKTSVIDLDGPYKKVSISNGPTTFSFEVPDAWLTETRNSGEVEMNEEELRDFLATDYFEDIRENPDSVGNYRDLHWDDLKNMSLDELKQVLKKLSAGSFSGPPNASVSGGRYISYMDISWYQVNFYILDKKKNANFLSKVTRIEDVSQAVEEYKNFNTIFQKEVRRDKQGAPIIDKGDSWGFRAYIEQGSQAIYIEKEAYMEGEFEDGFWHMLQTLQMK